MSARGIRAGQAYVEIGATDNELDRVLKRDIDKLNGFASSVAGLAGTIAGVGLAASAAFAPAVLAASEFEQTVAKFDTIFKDLSAGNKAWADSLAKEFGRSKQQIYSFLADSQTLLLPIGFQPGAAQEMSRSLTKLASDMGSFHNKADADVMTDFHAALTGSGEVMKKYGVIVSEASVKQELLNKGIDANKASEMEKVWARYNIIVRGTSEAHGDTIRSMGTFDNQMKSLQASVSDLSVKIGTALLPILTPVVHALATLAITTTNWIEQNQGVIQTLATIGPGLVTAAGAAGAFALAIKATAIALGIFRAAAGAATKAQAIMLAFQGPSGWAQLAVGAAAAAAAVYGINSAMNELQGTYQAAKGELDGVAKETEKIKELAKPIGGGGNLGAEFKEMFEKSLTPAMKLRRELEQLRQARTKWSKDGKSDGMFARLADEAINSASGIQDAMRKAREEIALFSGQVSESELELAKMAENGAPAELIAQYRQLQAARDAAKEQKDQREQQQKAADDALKSMQDDAKSVVSDTRTDEEKKAEERERLRRLRFTADPTTGKSFIDQDTYQRALQKLDEEGKPKPEKVQEETRRVAAGSDLRSAEGARDLAMVFGGGQDGLLKAGELSAKEAVKHTTILKQIKEGLAQTGPTVARIGV